MKNLFIAVNLKKKITKGTFILGGATAFESLLRFVRTMILTRVLAPEYFGLMATITAIVSTFEAFSEIGVRQAVIQNKTGNTPEFLNVSWWFSSLRGICLFILCIFVIPFICQFYENSELSLPLKVSFTILIFHGLVSPKIYVLEKEFRFLQFSILKLSPAIINVVVSIFLCMYFKNIWPLVIGFTIENITICLFSHIFFPFKPALSIHRPSLSELSRFAIGMFGLPLLTAIFLQIDIFAIGKLLSMKELGLYAIAQGLAFMPVIAFNKIIIPLILPTFSLMQDDKKLLKYTILKITSYISIFGIPFVTFCIMFSESILSIVFGEQYGVAAVPFSILIIYSLVRIYSTIFMQLFFALAIPYVQRNFAIIRLTLIMGLIYPAIKGFGLVGASLAVLCTMCSLLLLQLIWARKLVGVNIKIFVIYLLYGSILANIIILPIMIVKNTLLINNFISVIFGGLLCLVAWGFAVYRFQIKGKKLFN